MLDLRFLSQGLPPGGRWMPRGRGYDLGNRNGTSPSREYFKQKKRLSTSQKSLSDSNSPTEATKTLGSCKDQMSSLASLVELSEDAPDSVFPLDDSVASSTAPSPENFLLSGERSAADGKARVSIGADVKDETRLQRVASELPTAPSEERLNEKFGRFKDGSAIKSYTLSRPRHSVPQVSAYEMHEMEEYKRSRRELQETRNVISVETFDRFNGCDKEELIKLIVDQRNDISRRDSYICDLEDYIDNLLVKVIETQPKLLQNPYEVAATCASKKFSSSATPSTIPPSSTMPPGIYMNAAWGEDALPNSSTAAAAKKSNASKNNTKKPFLIASPFKKLQALIK